MEHGAPLVYLAGPLFSAAERAFNRRLAGRIEAAGFAVFLPQRDGVEGDRPPYDAMPREERRRAMFAVDVAEVEACDVFLVVLDGRVPDEGACFELGLAYGEKRRRQPGKRLIGLQTDARAAFLGAKLNPMLAVALDAVAADEEALLAELRRVEAGGAAPPRRGTDVILDQIDLIVRDVPAATAFFRDVLGLAPKVAEARFAELPAGPTTLMLSPEAMVPTEPAAGVIVHFRVDDVAEAVERARRRGATVLREPAPTDWGTESALIAGPERIVVDLYRLLPAPSGG